MYKSFRLGDNSSVRTLSRVVEALGHTVKFEKAEKMEPEAAGRPHSARTTGAGGTGHSQIRPKLVTQAESSKADLKRFPNPVRDRHAQKGTLPASAALETRRTAWQGGQRVKGRSMNISDTTVKRGSNNVFADLDLPDADSLFIKAGLVSRIDAIIRSRDITQAEAGRLLGLSQPDVSRLLAGDFREYSLERLLLLLARLGCDIEIVIRCPLSPAGVGALRIADAEDA